MIKSIRTHNGSANYIVHIHKITVFDMVNVYNLLSGEKKADCKILLQILSTLPAYLYDQVLLKLSCNYLS